MKLVCDIMSSFEFTYTKSEPEDNIKGVYDYELVSDPPSDEYICLICTLVAREAQEAMQAAVENVLQAMLGRVYEG